MCTPVKDYNLLTYLRQDAFTENYLTTQKSYVFSGVGVLIYVFDIESREFEQDLATYNAVIKALEEYSPRAHVFCLVHKMDLVQVDFRESLFEEREGAIKGKSGRFARVVTSYPTTIWDQSLYKAWGNIVHSLIPNLDVIENYLGQLAKAIVAEEIILFERTTFLTVMSVTSKIGEQNPYIDRQERLSNIVKTFKHSLAYVLRSLWIMLMLITSHPEYLPPPPRPRTNFMIFISKHPDLM